MRSHRVGRCFARHAPHLARGLVVTEEAGRALAALDATSSCGARNPFQAYDIPICPTLAASIGRGCCRSYLDGAHSD